MYQQFIQNIILSFLKTLKHKIYIQKKISISSSSFFKNSELLTKEITPIITVEFYLRNSEQLRVVKSLSKKIDLISRRPPPTRGANSIKFGNNISQTKETCQTTSRNSSLTSRPIISHRTFYKTSQALNYNQSFKKIYSLFKDQHIGSFAEIPPATGCAHTHIFPMFKSKKTEFHQINRFHIRDIPKTELEEWKKAYEIAIRHNGISVSTYLESVITTPGLQRILDSFLLVRKDHPEFGIGSIFSLLLQNQFGRFSKFKQAQIEKYVKNSH